MVFEDGLNTLYVHLKGRTLMLMPHGSPAAINRYIHHHPTSYTGYIQLRHESNSRLAESIY